MNGLLRSVATTCSISEEQPGDVVVVLHGDLDHLGVSYVADEVRWAVMKAHRSVTLDCADVGFVDSSGLRLLIEAESMAACRRDSFFLRHPSRQLLTLLHISGLDQGMNLRS